MNARTPYWPLFRNELGIDHCPKVAWALGAGLTLAAWTVVSFVPLLLLFKASEGNLATFFAAFGDLLGFALVWWLAVTGWMFAFALLPGMTNPLQNVRAFEFMFTRAIDRKKLFRIRAIVIYSVMLGPLLLNLLMSFNMPETKFGPDTLDRDASLFRREQYVKAFSLSLQTLGSSKIRYMPNEIPSGGAVVTAWIFWIGLLSLLLMQSYCVLITRRCQRNPWLAGVTIAIPVLTACFLAPWIPRHLPGLYETGFLFFAQHLVPLMIGLVALIPVVQTFSERSFNKLEIY